MIEGVDTTQSVLIGIRHGDTKYTDQFPDLTPKGINQIKNTAEELRDILSLYNRFVIIISPAARTQGSAKMLIRTAGLSPEKILISEAIRPVDIFDLRNFLEFQKQFSTEVFADKWLFDPFFDSESNHLTEKRKDVNTRAMNFLSSYLINMREDNKEPICTLVISHAEILANYLAPVEKTPGPRNGECVILQPDRYNPRNLTIAARSKLVKAQLNSSNRFELLA